MTLRLTVFVSLAIVVGGGFAWPFCVLLRGVVFPVGDWTIHTFALGRAQDVLVHALRRGPDGSAYIEMTGELRDYVAKSPGFRFAAFDHISGSPLPGSDRRLLAAIMPNEKRQFIPTQARVADDPNPNPNYYAYPLPATPIGAVEVALYGYAFKWEDLLRYVTRQIVQIDLPESLPPLVLTIFVCWFAVRQGLAPLGATAERLAQIDLDALDQRLPMDGVPEEIAPFISTLNEMLARLESGVARQQRFVANAAHELRTPIAALRARVDNPRDGDWRKDLRRGLRHLQAITEQ